MADSRSDLPADIAAGSATGNSAATGNAAAAANQPRLTAKVKLRQLNSPTSLTAEQLRFILTESSRILSDLYNKFDSNLGLDQSKFPIKEAANNAFRLIKTVELANPNRFPDPNQRDFHLLAADFVGFIQQAYDALLIMGSDKNGFPSQEQKQRLREVADFNIFSYLGVNQSDSLELDELLKLEEQRSVSEAAQRFVREVFAALDWQAPALTVEEEKTGVGVAGLPAEKAAESTVPGAAGEEKAAEGEGGEEPSQEPQEEIKKEERPQVFVEPSFNLANLDPQSKFYLQSLAIITVNQALTNFFNQETLAQYGLTSAPTFDQLPIGLRSQLLTIAFDKVRNLLAGGQYNLEDLIKTTSGRLNFSQEAALDLLLDINGIRLLTQEIGQLSQLQALERQQRLTSQAEQVLTAEQLTSAIRAEGQNNVLSSRAANQFFSDHASGQPLTSLLNGLGLSLSTVNEETLIDELSQLAARSGRDSYGAALLIRSNLIPTIKTFIQEGYPVDFLQLMDYSRFAFYFGTEIVDEDTFNAYRQPLINLLSSYWLSTRSAWAKDVRREVAYERFTPQQTEEFLQEVSGDSNKLKLYSEQLQQQRDLNAQYDGDEVVRALAGQKTDDPQLQLHQMQQQQRWTEYFANHFNAKKAADDRATLAELEVFIRFYAAPQQYPASYSFTIQDYRQAANGFSIYDLPAINANYELGAPLFLHAEDGQSAYLDEGVLAAGGPMSDVLGNLGQKAGGLMDGLGKKALHTGLRAGLAALTTGGSEAAFKALEAAKRLPIVGQLVSQLEDEALNKLLEFIKKILPFLLIAALFALIAALLPILLPVALALGALGAIWRGGLLKNLFAGGAVQQLGPQGGVGAGVGRQAVVVAPELPAATTIPTTAQAPAAAGTFSQLAGSAMTTATQAVVGAVSITALGVTIYTLSLYSAFLADFPAGDSSFLGSVEKTSKYARMEKNARIVSGCPSPENNNTKCVDPNFPVTIEYTITIEPKEDYTITVTSLDDQIRFRQNADAWQEQEGRPAPGVADQHKTTSDFPELANQESATIGPGEKLELSYRLENLDANYNHTSITNTLEVKFYYRNALSEGTDNMKTAARICLGECSGGAGCWPTTGTLSQMPFGTYSHAPPGSSGYADAYDIANQSLPLVYTPYAGNLCFIQCSDTGYGCYYVLSFNEGGADRKLLFAHFEQASGGLSQPNSCASVGEGEVIGVMGNRGNSTGPHLHYEVDYQGQFYHPASRNFSILETLVPETNQGNYPPQEGDTVSTCYE